MKAAVLEAIGAMPVCKDFEPPQAKDSEQIVHVKAAAIKQLDRAIAAGRHYSSPKSVPVVCGTDGVGSLADGKRVYFNVFRRPFGAMAEQAPAPFLVDVPDTLDDLHAAAVVNPALAAWLPLQARGKMQPGETVLILGATGAAGRFAVKAARLLGAGRVIGAGRRQDVLAGLDIDATIDLRLDAKSLAEAYAREIARGVHVILDYVWGSPAEIFMDQLVKTDLAATAASHAVRFVTIGEMAGNSITLPGATLRGSRLELIGSGSANFPGHAEMSAMIAEIFRYAGQGELPIAVESYPLAQVGSAWEAGDGEHRVVLTIG